MPKTTSPVGTARCLRAHLRAHGQGGKVLIERLGIAIPALARREIERNDAAHNGHNAEYVGIDWTDATLYAIALNTGRVPIEDGIEQTVRFTESRAFQDTPQSRGALMDE
jgi:hypothetical protein